MEMGPQNTLQQFDENTMSTFDQGLASNLLLSNQSAVNEKDILNYSKQQQTLLANLAKLPCYD